MLGPKFENLVDMQRKAVAKHGPRPVFGTKKGGVWVWTSYNEFGRRVEALRGGLAKLGLGRGSPLAMISRNRVEWAVAAYAVYGLGGHVVPMYDSQLPSDWHHILLDSGATVVIVSQESIYRRIKDWTGTDGQPLQVWCMELSHGHHRSLAALEAEGRESPAPLAELDPDEVCGIIYTSGTTGKPKGVQLSHRNVISNVNALHQIFPVEREDCSLSLLPWAHAFGQTAELHTLLSMGARMALAESAARLQQNFLEVQPTLLISVPRVFHSMYDRLQRSLQEGGLQASIFRKALDTETRRRQLAQEGTYQLWREAQHALMDRVVFANVRERFGGRLKYAFSGGAALSPKVAAFFDLLGIEVYEGYGLTETSPICTCNRPGIRKIGSIGQVLPDVSVTLDTSVIDDGSGDGELIVSGPNVMLGYHNLPEETKAVMTADGGFRTGDRGRCDEDGFFYITGRIKEQYKLETGKYVVPSPLEQHFQLSPFVAQVFIHGENKPFNVALIVPDRTAVLSWAKKERLEGDYLTILRDSATSDLIRMEIEGLSGDLRPFERIRHFSLIEEEFTPENGLLTATLKIKRQAVMQRYGKVIEALYEEVAPNKPN